MNVVIEAIADCRPPSPPDTLTLSGSVFLPTPGYKVNLVPALTHSGSTFNVDLEIEKLPGIWIQVLKEFPFSLHIKDWNGSVFGELALFHKNAQIAVVSIKKLY
jgi:hypothetical protein